MDTLSLKILKHLRVQDDDYNRIIKIYGEQAEKSVRYLSKEGYIASGHRSLGIGVDRKPVLASDGHYAITSKGIAYLEERPGKIFDVWLTRALAIWGALTGTISLVIELVQHFQ